MPYLGTIIEESLENKEVLGLLKILSTKVEPITDRHQTPWLKQWTLHKVEIDEDKVEEINRMLSEDLQKNYWYADYKNDKWHYIIFHGKIFQVDRANPYLYQEAREYGLTLGIPEYQVDFKG
ncbi:MAG: hypothetical protein HY336_00880 [Candidatus Doudnabacteria bacterium]|nr:hypothetical protein [Candidatus Doudnabacteria bacterium]